MSYAITNLSECRQFENTVANRIWEAWWKSDGHSAQEISDGVATISSTVGFPFALVAHADGEYLGHVLGIVSDLATRPDLTPWVAAFWVDPTHRRKGIASALLRSADGRFSALGYSKIYLCAIEEKRSYYTARRWSLIGVEQTMPVLDVFEKVLA